MIVIFSGYNQRAVIAFLRTLERNKIESFCIIASGKQDSILRSCYQEKVIYVRKKKQLDLDELIDALKLVRNNSNEESIFLTPSTEALNRFFLVNRDIFEHMNCIIPLANRKLYEQISDKGSFYSLCKEHGISVPQEYPDSNIFIKPVIAKPKKYISSDGKAYSPVFLLSEEKYTTFVKCHNMTDFQIQEFLNGGISLYLLFYFSHNGKVYCCSQKNLAQQPDGKSIVAACYSDFHNRKELIEPYIHLFQKVGFYGLVMVEVRLLHGKYYTIEANPRFWGCSQLFCDMGYNFFDFMLADYHLIDQVHNQPINKNAVYFWSGGVLGELMENNNCFWHEDGFQIVKKRFSEFISADIYKKKDTMNIYNIELLENLYMQTSKHSNYQVLSFDLKKILDENNLSTKSRQEWERLSYMKKHVDFRGKKILDIGGNTGFFSFEILEEGAEHVDYYEGNQIHAQFVQTASKVLGTEDKVSVYPKYFLFDETEKKYDIVLCLNVVHHLGDDFKMADIKDIARQEMIAEINKLSKCTDILIFQMGFNWKGDSKKCLFENGTKAEMEQFLKEGTKDYWDILFIGIAEKQNNDIIYQEMNKDNNKRQDDLGEFLNRPIFILKSKFKF